MKNQLARRVSRLPNDLWGNLKFDAEEPSTIHDTMEEAVDAATRMLKMQGGGTLTVTDTFGVQHEEEVTSLSPQET